MDNEKAKNLLDEFKEKLLAANQKQFVFLLVGRTGVGKSSTVNSLMGKEIAPVGDFEPTTMTVEAYPSEISGIQFKVIDTPGLCDDFEDSGNDYKYLELMRSQVKQVDSMWFVSRLDETRVTTDEKRGIKLISEAFGPDIWNHAIIVFTFANKVETEKYKVALEKRTDLIREVIAKYTGEQIAAEIPSIAVDNCSETTPDGKKWLGELYTKVFSRISKRAALPFLVATAEFITPRKYIPSSEARVSYVRDEPKPRIELNKHQEDEIRRTINANIIPGLAAVGGVAGFLLGPVGAAVGASAGAAVGLVAWLFSLRKN